METPFYEAKPILEKLQSRGFEAYYVGGAVRDFLLKRKIGDVDIATSAKPEDVKKLFHKTIDVGAEHGTIIVLLNENTYEVTTYRVESDYEDFRRPKSVAFITSLKEDLRRRDFTVNAMAMDIEGHIHDYFNGKLDLVEKRIKTVDSPYERFSEDALRMLRAIRFVSQLDFQLCPETEKAISELVHLLSAISIERKTVEVEKLFCGTNFQEAIRILIKCKMHNYLPGFNGKSEQLEKLSAFRFDLLSKREEIWTVITYYVKPSSVERFLRNWKLPVKLIKLVEKNIHIINQVVKEKSWTDLLLYEAGRDCALSVERIRSILIEPDQLYENVRNVNALLLRLPIQNKSQLDINGHDIIHYLNKKPGPWVSKVISDIEVAIIQKKLENNRSAIKEWLLGCNLDLE